MNGIDVSENNGILNWDLIKPDIDFAILRIGWIGNKNNHTIDKQFLRNYEECKKRNIKIGGYIYSYCQSAENAKSGALWTLNQINNLQFDLPIYIDMEDPTTTVLGRQKLTDIVIAFNTVIEKGGFWAGVYANLNWYNNFLNKEELKKRYTTWIAHFISKENSYKGEYDMWQNSSTYQIPGCGGNFDHNYLYRNLIDDIINSSSIKENDFQTTINKKLNTVIADEVIAGKWGNGADRQKLLEKHGYNYDEIQTIVNEKLGVAKEEKAYIVKYGDTLTKIAKLYGTTISKIATDNNIQNVNRIQVGQKLVIK